MFKDLTIGQYIERDSLVHKIDPRIKILMVTLFMVSIFLVKSLYQYIPIFIGIVLIAKLSQIPAKYIIKGIKPLRFILLLTFIVNAVSTPGESVGKIWIYNITYQGLLRASFMSIRLALLVMGTSLLTLTTSPIQLTDGLESIFTPLSKFGFPAHELAMMITIALRFIPTLIEKSEEIMKAQTARGADFESGNVIQRGKNMVPLLVPLFLNSFRRATDLATAMEARCYRGAEGRTRLNPLKLDKKDRVSLIIFLICLIAIIAVGTVL